MKNQIKQAMQRVGFDIVRHPRPPASNSLTNHLQLALRHHPVDGAVDVGGHLGGFAHLLRDKVGYQGPLVSFEPVRANYEALVESRKGDSNWVGHNLALGVESGNLSLNVHESTDFSSFMVPTAFGTERFAGLRSSDTEHVAVRRLDDVLDLPGRLLLKTDTQGFDMEVLRGATAVLPRVSVLVIELSALPIYEGMPGMMEMMGSIAEMGFESAGMSVVSRDGARVVEYDGVFVRARAGNQD